VLGKHAGIDLTRYLTINPDDVKEEMGRRGLIPDVPGLSPMEASDLVHDVKNDEHLSVINAEREHPVAVAEYSLAESRVSVRRHQVCVPRFPDQIHNAFHHRVECIPWKAVELGERGTLEFSSVGHPPARRR
jgi:hypothetical protein